ncbi:helix-turn-helix domain-containing protein [Mesorhizobium sp. M1423]|uniref:helix-turn-helix domain-containing protein n=1 Tax=Mesorhizobium sp. M1423 TaxID=2957101 RepID=UPI00333B44F1
MSLSRLAPARKEVAGAVQRLPGLFCHFLNLVGELGLREMTGTGRFRAWGIV